MEHTILFGRHGFTSNISASRVISSGVWGRANLKKLRGHALILFQTRSAAGATEGKQEMVGAAVSSAAIQYGGGGVGVGKQP